MSIVFDQGKILFVGGKIAFDTRCCCGCAAVNTYHWGLVGPADLDEVGGIAGIMADMNAHNFHADFEVASDWKLRWLIWEHEGEGAGECDFLAMVFQTCKDVDQLGEDLSIALVDYKDWMNTQFTPPGGLAEVGFGYGFKHPFPDGMTDQELGELGFHSFGDSCFESGTPGINGVTEVFNQPQVSCPCDRTNFDPI